MPTTKTSTFAGVVAATAVAGLLAVAGPCASQNALNIPNSQPKPQASWVQPSDSRWYEIQVTSMNPGKQPIPPLKRFTITVTGVIAPPTPPPDLHLSQHYSRELRETIATYQGGGIVQRGSQGGKLIVTIETNSYRPSASCSIRISYGMIHRGVMHASTANNLQHSAECTFYVDSY